ncbi:MAG: SPOR domain-containing protein [Propionivibrio sp.]
MRKPLAVLRNLSIRPIPMSDSSDANLQLKKRARRRLVGAFAFAGLAAVILPMVMDEEPKQQVQDVQIRIPGQDQSPFVNKLAKAAPDSGEPLVPPEGVEPAAHGGDAAGKPAEVPAETTPVRQAEKGAEKPVEKASEKAPAKVEEKKKTAEANDTQRAAAILDGKAGEAAAKPVAGASGAGNGQFVILIGAFSNPANVKQLQTKIGELGIKVYTEPLDSPGGKKTRVRAGPFPNREAADKALGRLKRIGVNGVVAAK